MLGARTNDEEDERVVLDYCRAHDYDKYRKVVGVERTYMVLNTSKVPTDWKAVE